MTNLVIMESPSKATTVKGYLGSSYKVVASKGHIRDLPKSTLGIDIDRDTTSYYAVVECSDPEFTLQTEQHFIVRSNDCDPDRIPVAQGETVHAGSIDIADLKRGDRPIDVVFSDKEGYQGVNLDDYEVTVDNNSLFVEDVTVGKKDNNLMLTPKLR